MWILGKTSLLFNCNIEGNSNEANRLQSEHY